MQEPQPTMQMPNPVAEAEAEAIRSRTYVEAEALRLKAEAEAAAVRAKAEADAEKQRIANERAAMALDEKRAEHEARMAKAATEREEADRQAAAAREAEAAERVAAAALAEETAGADEKWRKYAIRFAVVCGIVALPVQMAAFWNPDAIWLVAAPVMLEGGSWVVQRGAAAAVANRRPLWHYRTIAWLLAFVAAGINFWHGLNAFDPATAIATAFASVAGPGVWDLHEHGRIRKRDGVLSRKERKAQEKEEKKTAEQKAVREAEQKAAREAADRAAAEVAAKLAADREQNFPKVWEHALKLASALGETTVTESVWRRAHKDIEGTDPGDSVDVIRGRNTAARRLEAARSEAPGNAPIKVGNAQRANQMPRAQRGPARKPPVRHPGDTQSYVTAARKQAAIAAKQAASGTQGDGQK